MKLPKSARLHHRSLQERLFAEGEKIHEFPLKLIWNPLTPEQLEANFRSRVPDLIGPVQAVVSVPKKKRRRAVDRVLMRRRIREAYRLSRGEVLEMLKRFPQVRTLSVGIIFMKEANVPYAEISEKLNRLWHKLEDKLITRYEPSQESADRDVAPAD